MPASDALKSASGLLAAGRKVQTWQIRTLSENIANANSTAKVPGGDSYSRKIAVFNPVVPDSETDPIGRIARDTTDFHKQYDPANAVANVQGYVQLPNVNTAVESTNLQTIIRAYEMNLNASSVIDKVNKATIDLLG